MKKVLLLAAIVSIPFNFVFSQANTLPASGNVGIGTTAPNGPLAIQRNPGTAGNEIYFTGQSGANQNSNSLRLNFVGYAQTAGFGMQALHVTGYGTKDLVFYAHDGLKYSDYTTYDEVVRFTYNGKVGIGTTSPQTKLHVTGSTFPVNRIERSATSTNNDIVNSGVEFLATTSGDMVNGFGVGNVFSIQDNAGVINNIARFTAVRDGADNSGALLFETYNAGTRSEWLRVNSIGNIGIGTITPNSNAKLDVNGNIYCNNKIFIGISDANTTTKIASYELAVNGDAIFNKAVVKLYSNWPDYVFDEKYQLRALPDLEKFIKENKRLPDVPSAIDVQKDGIDLGSNQTILLQKIEELTLYLIEQNKKIEEQNKRIEQLENKSTK